MTSTTLPVAEHRHVGGSAGGPGENSAECACGTVFDGLDSRAEATALLDQHIEDEANTRRARELKPGDWVAGLLANHKGMPPRDAEIAGVYPYTDAVETARVLLVTTAPGPQGPETVRLAADWPVRLLTEAEREAMRLAAERVKKIAEIHAFADWLAANPWVPAPYEVEASEHLSAPGDVPTVEVGLAKVREVAQAMGAKVDESLSDRTSTVVSFGDVVSYRLIAWHRDGRPAGPPSQAETDAAKFDSDSLVRAAAQAYDEPAGFDYSRDMGAEEPDLPVPVSPGRILPHFGAVVDGGELVDETPAVNVGPSHFLDYGSHGENDDRVACGKRVDQIGGYVTDLAEATCPACVTAMALVEPVSEPR